MVTWPSRGVEQVGNYVFIGFLSLGLGTIAGMDIQVHAAPVAGSLRR